MLKITRIGRGKLVLCAAMLLAGALSLRAQVTTPLAAGAPAAAASNEFVGSTEPSEKRILAVNVQGIILESMVKDGDLIKKGQLLMKLDDRGEQKQLEILDLDAKSPLAIDYAKTDLAAKEVEFIRKKKLFEGGTAGSQAELDEARFGRDLAAVKVKQAELEEDQKKLKAEQQAVRVEQMKLLSPIDGVVEKRHLGVGELAVPDPNKPVLTVVKNDPLKVVVYLPTAVTEKLSLGDALQVRHENDTQWASGKLTYLSPVADAASGSRLVHLELPNAANRQSGVQVVVKLPEKLVQQTPPR